MFENGDTWVGQFIEDRPVVSSPPTADGGAGIEQPFVPRGQHLTLPVEDLVVEEESAAAALKGIGNVLMVYNSDLRSLYDKYWCV